MPLDRYELATHIRQTLQGRTGLNFQDSVCVTLDRYYSWKGKQFEAPSPAGGDKKNDGWVEEDALFYQIYAPSTAYASTSFKKELRGKFDEDLTGLLGHLDNGLWGGRIESYVFLVNTVDQRLPENSDNYYETSKKDIIGKRPYNFECKVCNLDYIQELLEEIEDEEVLRKISTRISAIRIDLDPSSVDAFTMVELIDGIANVALAQPLRSSEPPDYMRVSSDLKIDINQLEDRREDIENCISYLGIVEKAVSILNQTPTGSDRFEGVKALVISCYRKLALTYEGVELLDRLCDDLRGYSSSNTTETPVFMLVIFIFDLCDIFKKEVDPNDSSK